MDSQLEPDLQYPVDWGRKCIVDLNTGKTQLVSFDQSNNTDTFLPTMTSISMFDRVYLNNTQSSKIAM